MKKVDLSSWLSKSDVKEPTVEMLKNINGGCTITIGRCVQDGAYFVASVQNPCSNYSNYMSHITKAFNAAKGIKKGTSITVSY